MRNRTTFHATKDVQKAPIAPVAPAVDMSAIQKQIDAIKAHMATPGPALDMDAILQSLEAAARRPSRIAVRVVRDGEGRTVAMIGTTDPAEIAAIEKRHKSDSKDESLESVITRFAAKSTGREN